MKRRIIFLDIDGVLVNLNSLKSKEKDEDGLHIADPHCVDLLNQLVKMFDAEIVVSSTWRNLGLDKVIEVLKRWGVEGKVVGATPNLSYTRESGLAVAPTRGDEIRAWLDVMTRDGYEVDAFVILDDDGDMGELDSHLVQTDFNIGLTKEDIELATSFFWDQEWPNARLMEYQKQSWPFTKRLQRALFQALHTCELLLNLKPCNACKASPLCLHVLTPFLCDCECHELNRQTVEEARAFVESFMSDGEHVG